MQAVVIDDENAVRNATKSMLSIYCPEIEIIGEADGIISGIALIKTQKPQLIFLDVEMQDGTGFDLIHSFPDREFSVIFITGHHEYAVKAFKFSAIDYILKPIDPDDLIRAVQKAMKSFETGISALQIRALKNNLENKSRKVVLRDAESVYLIPLDEIVRCESDDNYTKFYISDGRKILISNTLKEYEQLFAEDDFFRCHQSHLINLHFFSRFDKKDGGTVHLKDGSILPVSIRKKETLLKLLESI